MGYYVLGRIGIDKLSENILKIDKVICDNITLLKDVDRGILS